MARLASIAVVGVAFACAPANPTPEVVKPVGPLGSDASTAGPGFATPARWALTYSSRWRSAASIDLDSGSKLSTGDGGERWIESLSGSNDGASTLAPERIVGIQKLDGTFRFVGASGTVYLSHDPLGSLLRTGTPVEGTRQVAVGKTAILVVDGKGELERSIDGGRTWAKIDLPQKDLVVVDVAMLAESGILVAAPQRFFGTKDDGVTWTPVKSPGIGVQTVVSREGALWIDGVESSLRFDSAWATFQPATPHPASHARGMQTPAQPVTRIDGRRAIQLTGNGNERVWSIAVADPSGLGKPHKVDELDGCEMVDAAMRGDEVVVACDARGTLASGIDRDATTPIKRFGYSYGRSSGLPDGGSLGWITRVLRSNDGARTFHEEASVEGGIPQRSDVAVAIGGEDFIYLGRRCGPGYNAPCLPARVRATKSAGFSELPEDEGTNNGQVRFASSGMQSIVYSLGVRDNEAFLFKWKPGSAVPEPIGRVAQTIEAQSATLTVDDDGTVRGFAHYGSNGYVFVYKEGGTITTTQLPLPFARAAFAGVHGFGFVTSSPGETKAYETVDSGKTWGEVAAPAFMTSVDGCTAYGCVTDRGLRWGWDAPAPTTGSVAQVSAKTQYARPLRCSAKDKWIELGGGNLPNIGYVDHGNARWVLPTRDKDGKINLITSKRGESTTKTSSVALMGAPPGPPKFGAGTTVHVQPDGVAVVRYSYLRERKGFGRYNPVDAQLAWYRDATGKVLHATVNKNPPFRVNKDPQGGYDRDQQPAYTELPELVALGPKGVYFHSEASYEEDDTGNGTPKRPPLMLLRDDGKTDKIALPEDLEINGAGMATTLDGVLTLLAHNPESWTAATASDGHKTFYSVLGGLGDDDGAVDLLNLGGKAAFAATLRDPPRAWIVGLKSDPDLGPSTPMATQKSLGDTPKACDGAPSADPNAYRIDAPYVVGSRRPVVIDSDGVAVVMATDRAEIRGMVGQPDACVAAYDALVPSPEDDRDYGALIFTDDLGHSLLFRAETAAWPATIAVRPMECQYQAGPLPEALENVEGFVPDKRHAAVPRKRY